MDDITRAYNALTKQNVNAGILHMLAKPMFDHRKPLVVKQFVLWAHERKEITEFKPLSPERRKIYVQSLAGEYAETHGIEILHAHNAEIVVPIAHYIVKEKFGQKSISDFREANRSMYDYITDAVAQYLWHDKPLRGYFEMPATVDLLGNTVFARSIEPRMSEQDKERFIVPRAKGEPFHIRDSDDAIDDLAAQNFIIQLLQKYPLEAFDYYRVSECVRIPNGQALSNLKWLAASNEEIIEIRKSKNRRVYYKWCPETKYLDRNSPVRLEATTKMLNRLIRENPRRSKKGVRDLLRRYCGSMDNRIVDEALAVLCHAGLVSIERGEHKLSLCYVPQELTDEGKRGAEEILKAKRCNRAGTRNNLAGEQ